MLLFCARMSLSIFRKSPGLFGVRLHLRFWASLLSERYHPPVHFYHCSIDEAGIVTSQPGHCTSNIFDFSYSSHRYSLFDLFNLLLGPCLAEHGCINAARMDCIDANAVLSQLGSGGQAKAAYCKLARRIHRQARVAAQACN